MTLVVTEAGRQVMAYETGFDMPARDGGSATLAHLGLPEGARLKIVAADDLFDAIASGSHRVDGQIVAPCSMGFAGKLAAGLADDLPSRAADVCLKERVPLILVPRETPLNLIHLRNLTALAEAGAIVLPAMPGFYHRPETVDDLVSHVVGKILDVLGLEHDLFERWGGISSAEGMGVGELDSNTCAGGE